jgi:hypothetical protein
MVVAGQNQMTIQEFMFTYGVQVVEVAHLVDGVLVHLGAVADLPMAS